MLPSLLDLKQWAKLLVLHGECGTWSPWRSHVVQWSSSDSVDDVNTYESNRAPDGSSCFYYKANDCGAFDLSYDPEGVEVSLKVLATALPGKCVAPLEAELGSLSSTGDSDDVTLGGMSPGERRAAEEHSLFDKVCEAFLAEVAKAVRRALPALSAHEVDMRVRWIASQEVAAWQAMKYESNVRPLTARIVWQANHNGPMNFAL